MENGYPKPLGNAFNGVRSFYQVPWCAGWDCAVYQKNSIHDISRIKQKKIPTHKNFNMSQRKKGKKLF